MKSSELIETKKNMLIESEQIISAAEAESRSLTEEENTRLESLRHQITSTSQEIVKAEAREFVEAAQAEMRSSKGRQVAPTPTVMTRSKTEVPDGAVVRSWLLSGSKHYRPDADMVYAAAERGIDLGSDAISLRALSTGTNSAGGYTVPTGFVPELAKKLAYFCNFRNFATVKTTPNGENLPWPTLDNTTQVASQYTEVASVADSGSNDPAFGQVTLKRWRFSTDVLLVSVDLFANSAIPDFEGELYGMLAEQMGRSQSGAMGGANAGSAAPQGFLNGLTAAVNLASGNAITFDKLVDLETSIDPAYLDQPGIGYVMHSATYGAIRKMADSQNRPLYLESLSAGGPGRMINGYPVYFCNTMTSISSPGDNQPLIAFGKLNDYVIRDIPSMVDVVKYSEVYRKSGQIGLQVEGWWDARWVRTGSVKTLNSYDAP